MTTKAFPAELEVTEWRGDLYNPNGELLPMPNVDVEMVDETDQHVLGAPHSGVF